MALVMALGMTVVLGILGTTAMAYTTSNSTESAQSGGKQNAFSLAEAGINNSMAVLNLPTNNSLDPDVLPNRTSCATNLGSTCTAPYGDGYVVWGGPSTARPPSGRSPRPATTAAGPGAARRTSRRL